ncbi:MAG TPA: hypothetical protein VGF88_22175 [Acidobacteriaceae bacterium]|jgi:hypothetical protein
MAILFAAPFILLAGIAFVVLSLVPRARPWAIPIPAGVLGAGPTALVGLFVGAVLIHSLPGPGHGPVIAFCCAGALTGLVGGFLMGAISRFVISILSVFLLRLTVFVAGWCSFFVIPAGALLWLNRTGPLPGSIIILLLEILLSLIGAWLMAQKSQQFRLERIRVPYGAPFRRRKGDTTTAHTR